MNLYAKLAEREAAARPIRIGMIGAGKFGTMFLTQVRRTPGMHLAGLADLNVERARSQLASAGWDAPQHAASSLDEALKTRATFVTDNAEALPRRVAEMRRDYEIVELAEGMVDRQWFDREHIDAGAGDLLPLQYIKQRILIDDRPARGVDEIRRRLHPR